MGLLLSKAESEFLPGAWFPSALYPAGKTGPPSGPSYIQFPKPEARSPACKWTRRALSGGGAGAPGVGTEYGFRGSRQKGVRQGNGLFENRVRAERQPRSLGERPGDLR